MIRSSKWNFLLLTLILLLAFSVRIIHLLGDAPAADVSRSGVFYVDEGTYAHNAVNKLLFGEWFLKDDYNAITNVPIFSLTQYLILKIFGVSLFSLRIGGIIYTILALILLWVLIKKWNTTLAYMVIILASLNYFYIVYNRLALLENLLILFLILNAFFLYLYYKKKSAVWLVIAIIIFWLSFFVKPTSLFLLPLLIITILKQQLPRPQKLYHLYYYFILSSFLLTLAYLFWIIPHKIDWYYFQGRNIHYMINESFLIFLINYARYFSNLKLFQFMPLTYLIFLLHISYLLYEIFLQKKLSFVDWFFLGWAICGFLFLGFFKYSPPRLSLILIPPIIVLSASFLYKLYHNQVKFGDKNIYFLLIPISILAMGQIGFGFYRILVYEQRHLSCYLPLLSLVFIPLFIIIMKGKINHKKMALALFFFILIINVFQIQRYYHNIQYSYYNAICDIKQTIQHEKYDKNILLGDIAPLISVELKMKAVNIIFKSDTEDIRILNNRPNLLILQENRELHRLYQKVPFYFQNLELLKSYKIFNNYINNDNTYLYRIDNDLLHQKLWVNVLGDTL